MKNPKVLVACEEWLSNGEIICWDWRNDKKMMTPETCRFCLYNDNNGYCTNYKSPFYMCFTARRDWCSLWIDKDPYKRS